MTYKWSKKASKYINVFKEYDECPLKVGDKIVLSDYLTHEQLLNLEGRVVAIGCLDPEVFSIGVDLGSIRVESPKEDNIDILDIDDKCVTKRVILSNSGVHIIKK